MSADLEVVKFIRGEDFALEPSEFAVAIETLDRLWKEATDDDDQHDLRFAANVLEAVYQAIHETVRA